MADLLAATTLTGEQAGFVETIRTSGAALLAVINDILDFSKIEAGKLHIEDVPFDLRPAVEECVELLAGAAAAKHLPVQLELDPDLPPYVSGDPSRLRQVLLNLISNAIKFTHQGRI